MTNLSISQFLPKSTLGMVATGAGLCFLGYCVYFDRKRRSDPDFKKKLKEKRNKAKNQKKKGTTSQLPDLTDPESVQRFFLQEVQLGEELLAQGDVENAVEHLSNAVVVCGRPTQLVQVLQQTLPPQVFQLLMLKLQTATPIVEQAAGAAPSSGPTLTLAEDDVE